MRLGELSVALGFEDTRQRGVWTPDLVAFSLLVFLTLVGGRVFAKVRLVPGEPVFVTEMGVLVIAALAIWRVGLRGLWTRVRRFVPLIPLLLLWLAGAIATLRGLHSYGLRMIQPDIGLVEYSIFIPLTAAVIDTRARAVRLLAAMLRARP